ncbi:MAG: hypothetical protein CM1200mP16_16220 [Nitrospina sp.]|nr:MAG: hypothetical protein CM1200mP16_16220 [Nitrospina sp.]
MAYECKVYDKKGKTKKNITKSELTKSSQEFFNQRSLKKSKLFYKNFKRTRYDVKKGKKFYNKTCVVCQKEFHPRHPNSKYCSHECQKILYLAKKKKGNPG